MTTTGSDVLVDRDGPTTWITLNRPASLNAITPTMAHELLNVFEGMTEDLATRVVVLRGAGRGFCAGLDIKHALRLRDDGGPGLPLPEIIRAMRACPQPIVALVHGAACGGGLAFALAADIRIAGESARMNDAAVNLGVSGCELGMSYFLPRHVGLSIATELMYTGRFIDARRAYQVGLVSELVPDDQLDSAGRKLAADMLRVAPLALRKTKQTLGQAMTMTTLDQVLALEDAAQQECLGGEDFEEGLRAFAENRAPRFADARPLPT